MWVRIIETTLMAINMKSNTQEHSKQQTFHCSAQFSIVVALEIWKFYPNGKGIHTQENRVLQGSPLSGTLFELACDDIFAFIKYPVTPILFADDLRIHISTNDQQRVHRKKLQDTIDLILEWADQFGFRFPHPKTNLISFKKRNPKTYFPPLNFKLSLSQQQKPSRSSDSDSTIVTLGYLTWKNSKPKPCAPSTS